MSGEPQQIEMFVHSEMTPTDSYVSMAETEDFMHGRILVYRSPSIFGPKQGKHCLVYCGEGICDCEVGSRRFY